MDGETSETELQQIRETNKLAINKMWQEAIFKLKFEKTDSGEFELIFDSSEQNIVSSDGFLLPVKLSLTGKIGSLGLYRINVNIKGIDSEQIAQRKYTLRMKSPNAICQGYIQVEQEFDQIGIGSSLIGLDEVIEPFLVKKVNDTTSKHFLKIEQHYADQTSDQNPKWTVRRFKNDPRFTKVGDTWVRTILVES